MSKRIIAAALAVVLALALLAGCSQTVPDPEGSVVSPEGFVPYGEEPAFVNQQYASDDTVIFYAGLLLKEKPTANQLIRGGIPFLLRLRGAAYHGRHRPPGD